MTLVKLPLKYNPFSNERDSHEVSAGVVVFLAMAGSNPEILDPEGNPDIEQLDNWLPLVHATLAMYLDKTLGVDTSWGSRGVEVASYFAVQQYLQFMKREDLAFRYKDSQELMDYRQEGAIILSSTALLLQRPDIQTSENSPTI